MLQILKNKGEIVMNYTEQIFKMLKVEPFEEFKIKDYDLNYIGGEDDAE